ncbi:uncharacterized protein LOC117796470 [Ailuropoda melanoleuca]|uniref:uncharacterized protein LOC117796470 n=1 Tax=Ailuropoda melanoleuca TaxID=9646 RepID=UPI0014948C70|nr:uncharacterized protein LOC117796470 [Ailuropoda melanoleuca]
MFGSVIGSTGWDQILRSQMEAEVTGRALKNGRKPSRLMCRPVNGSRCRMESSDNPPPKVWRTQESRTHVSADSTRTLLQQPVTRAYKRGTLTWSSHADPKFKTKKVYLNLQHPMPQMGECHHPLLSRYCVQTCKILKGFIQNITSGMHLSGRKTFLSLLGPRWTKNQIDRRQEFLSHSLKAGSPRSRRWQIQCLDSDTRSLLWEFLTIGTSSWS